MSDTEKILQILQTIQTDIEQIKRDISDIKGQTTKMDSHVDFVNDVYEKVKAPLNYACNAFYLTGTDENPDNWLLEN